MKMIHNIKRIVNQNSFLFHLYYHLYRNNRGVRINYFNKNIKFLLDGYPRSGNTFALWLARDIFGPHTFVHHFHAIAPVKMALRRNIPAFILIREPAEAITSNYLKEFALKNRSIPKNINMDLLKELTSQYVDYYEYIQQQKNKLEIINFRELIGHPEQVINRINQLVFHNSHDITPSKIEESINSNKGATDTYGSSKPNPEKELLKSELKEELFKMFEYKEAEIIFGSFN